MTLGQSKIRSFWEAISNTVIGFLVTLVVSPFFYYLVGINYTWSQLGVVTLLFTLVSIIRGFIIRRFFNKHEKSKEQGLLEQIWRLKEALRNLVTMKLEEKIQALNLLHGYWEDLRKEQSVNRVLKQTIDAQYLEVTAYKREKQDIKEESELLNSIAATRIESLEAELASCKSAFQHFASDVVESGQLNISQESNKSNSEDYADNSEGRV